MPFQVSPSVEVREVDLTAAVPALSTSIGAIAGSFGWGPVSQIVNVSTENQLAEIFGQPDDFTFKYFLPAAQHLQYSNVLRVVRTDREDSFNATSGTADKLIRNSDDFETTVFASDEQFVAKYPGELGNSIGVIVVSSEDAFDDAAFTETGYNQLFDRAPGTTTFAEDRGALDDELHVVIFDTTGRWTGSPGTVLERFAGLSQAKDARQSDGTNNYYVDVINNRSQYVWVGAPSSELTNSGESVFSDNLGSGGSFATSATPEEYTLEGGSDGSQPDTSFSELTKAYDLFANAEFTDIGIIIGTEAGSDDVSLANALIAIAESRKDCVACVSPRVSRTTDALDPTSEVKDWADQITSSSYGILDSSALFVFDKFNDKFRFIVASGSVAGLLANTDQVSEPWFSPAGFSRGQLRGVTRLAFNPDRSQRDTLYQARVNPIVAFPGEGIVLFGDKTAQATATAFDRINVRRLFITLEKAISTAAQTQLFEINDQFTRAQFRNLVEPFLREVQGRRGVTDFNVVCDDTNNTPEVIDTNRFVADIFIKPVRSINFIRLNFVAVRTGVEFSEIAGN